jgi:prepilin-type N-terminal cleavage/methylation domain-containing protein
MRRGRGGFTMVELIIVVVLGSLVLAAALQVLITNQRTYTAQTAQVSGQQSVRVALEVLFNELRELSPGGGDILSMSSNGLGVRLMRKFSVVCATDFSVPLSPVFTVPNALMGPFTRFANGDSVFVFADNRVNVDNDDHWIAAEVTAVNTAQTCPQTGNPPASALVFGLQGALFDFATDSVGLGAPIRSYERVRYGLTTYNGDPYLGRQREADASPVPVAGPLRAGTGLEFVYRDSLGAITSTPAEVRQIVVRIRSGSGVLNSLGETVSDSILAWVYTRN